MPGPKSHDEQIEEIRKNTQPPFQPTDYTGLKLDNRLADQIAQQDLGEILSFERRGNITRIQVKLPEKGFDPASGKEFNIRVNMNYLMRGMVRGSMDESGRLDWNKTADLFDIAMNMSHSAGANRDRLCAQLSEALGVPENAREDFQNFLYANCQANPKDRNQPSLFNINTSPLALMQQEINRMAVYQKLMAGEPLPENLKAGLDANEWKKMLDDMSEDYENLAENYRQMAEIDPLTETRILQPSDCRAFRGYASRFIDQHNQYRERNGQPPLRYSAQDYDFTKDGYGKKLPENTERYFDEHHLLTVPIKLDGKDVVLTLENTAPPAGKMFERPAVERTGVGLFENEDAAKQFHFSVNLGEMKNKEELQAFDSFARITRLDPTDLTPNSWEAVAQHAQETAKKSKDPEVVADCFARHLYAQSVVESADRDKRMPFDKKMLDQSVEELKQNKSFKLMAQTYGVEGMRRALAAPDPQVASIALFAPQQSKRYAVNDTVRKQLRALSARMQTKGRSEEWQKLRDALSDPEMQDASWVFDAVEAYTKGKKSVRMTKQGRESFDLAMTALAIAAKNGDPAARQRAQNLVDRINEVRGSADPKHTNHVSLQGYEPKNLEEMQRKAAEREAKEAQRDAERLAKDAQDPARAEKNQKFLGWLGKQPQGMSQEDRADAELYVTNHPGVREEARRIAEERGLPMDIPKTRQQPEKQQEQAQNKGPETGV